MILESTFDEFNSYPAVNFYRLQYPDYPSTTTVTFEGYECLYPLVENLIVVPYPEGLHKLSTPDRQKIITEHIKSITDEYISAQKSYLDANTEHIYNYVFGSFTRYITEHLNTLFKAPDVDLEIVKNIYSNIQKPIVCVNGRNLHKHACQNNLMKSEIEEIISLGYFVVNCTINQPDFKFDSDSYLEPGIDELKSYNRTLAYFSQSDYLVAVARNSGVTTHIMGDLNIIIYGPGGWVDNSDFGFNGESIFSARQKYVTSKKTYKANNVEELKNILKPK